MRKILCLFVSMLFLGMSACGECQHEWKEATCTSPKTCEKCGATDGVALSHKWGEASCDEYPVCTVCGTKSGTAVEHQWDKKYDSGDVKYDAKCEKCGMKYETYQEKELERTMSASTARSIAMKKAKSELEQKYSSSSHVINIRDADDGVLSYPVTIIHSEFITQAFTIRAPRAFRLEIMQAHWSAFTQKIKVAIKMPDPKLLFIVYQQTKPPANAGGFFVFMKAVLWS